MKLFQKIILLVSRILLGKRLGIHGKLHLLLRIRFLMQSFDGEHKAAVGDGFRLFKGFFPNFGFFLFLGVTISKEFHS